MAKSVPLVEIWRGDFLESQHRGHAVVWDAGGDVVASWGDPDALIFPRSSCKMLQALPLVESGAADAAGLTSEHLALSCASHNGARIHHQMVSDWLGNLGMGEQDLRCGPQLPNDAEERTRLMCGHDSPDQCHNNCSGKHSGFLTLNRHLGGGAEYVEIDHPVQQAVRAAFEETTQMTSPGFGIDGCSAPNFVTSVAGLTRAMASYAVAGHGAGARDQAQARLVAAMMAHPHLVAGEGRACTRLMRAMNGQVAVKTGAEAVFVAIVPKLGMGVALKIEDGATRASEAAITALLIGLGVLDPNAEVAQALRHGPITNRRNLNVGHVNICSSLADWRLYP